MRIPVKAQYKGYTPALDPFSKEKLVWFKPESKTKKNPNGLGLPSSILLISMPFVIGWFSFWSYKRAAETHQHNDEYIIYNELGHDRFIALFVIAIILGVLSYIWGLFSYDFKRIKKYSRSESIKLYKKAPLITKDKEYQKQLQPLKKNWWWAIPASLIMIVIAFLILFDTGSSFFAGYALAVMLYLTLLFVLVILYYPTLFFARKYLDRRFDIKPNKKQS